MAPPPPGLVAGERPPRHAADGAAANREGKKAYSIELRILFCAIVPGIFQLLLSVAFNVAGRGLAYGVGPRDEPPKPLGKVASRIERAYRNFLETFAFFAVAVLLGQAVGRPTVISALGAWIYIAARVLYLPAYIAAVPVARTLLWAASILGIAMVMSAVWPG